MVATYWPTATAPWKPAPAAEQWPTETPSWIDPYAGDDDASKQGLTKSEVGIITSVVIIGLIIIAVAAFFIIRNLRYKKIVKSACDPDPLV